MAVQILKFEFEYGCICLWDSKGIVYHSELPISNRLKKELDDICVKTLTMLLIGAIHTLPLRGQENNVLISLT